MPPSASDEDRLHELGYAQELDRDLDGFANFAVSFTVISVLSGCLTLFGYGMTVTTIVTVCCAPAWFALAHWLFVSRSLWLDIVAPEAALQFDIEALVEQPREPFDQMSRRRSLPRCEQSTERTAGAACHCQQAVGMAVDFRQRQGGERTHLEIEVRPADEPHQIEIALLVLHQQGQPIDGRQLAGRCNAALVLAANGDVAADDRLDAGAGGILGKLQRTKQVSVIGHGDGRHCRFLGEGNDLVDLVRSFRERIGGSDFQMNEICNGHAPLSRAAVVESEE